MPVSTPSLATRAALVATGTTAVALLTLLPAAPPAPASTAAVAPVGESAPAPFQAARHALGTTPAAPVAPAVQAPVKLVAAAKPARTGRGRGGRAARQRDGDRDGQARRPVPLGRRGPRRLRLLRPRLLVLPPGGPTLPRSSRPSRSVGTPVAKGALQPGDLVFFYRPVSHVAIYIGNGRVVHASTAGKPVKISNLNDMPFATARRI